MEITKRTNKNGTVWVVRWRESGTRHARTFHARKLAEAFAAQCQRDRDLRILNPGGSRGAMLLDEFFQEWQRGHGIHLARSTQADYASTWARHVSAAIGHYTLEQIAERPEIIQQFQADLSQVTGAPTVRRTLMIVQGVLQRAIEWNRIRYNPAAAIRKPRGKRARAVHPLLPEQVERAIGVLAGQGRQRDVTLVAVLAYAGLRPGEALALHWRHVRTRTLLIEGAAAYGELKETKTGKVRSVRLMSVLAADLESWRAAQAPDSTQLVFARADGGLWSASDWKNWRGRIFVPAMREAGVDCRRPYDLRHSYCSLLIQEGRSVVEVAQQMGHSPEMTLSTYAHVFAEAADPLERAPAEELIERARAQRLLRSRGLRMDATALRGIQELGGIS